MANGRSIRLYLVDGTPKGLVTAEIVNWSGHVLSGPRSKLAEILKREESSRSGVYLLVGESPEDDLLPLVYIGESEEVGRRLRKHNLPEPDGKDFWNHAWIITSQNLNLTKSHIKYLERQLIEKSRASKSCKLDNKDSSGNLPLPEADVADMNFFLTQLEIILPVMDFDHLRSPTTQKRAQELTPVIEASPQFKCSIAKDGVFATAIEVEGQFIVCEGSAARGEWVGTKRGYMGMYERLRAGGVLVEGPEGLLIFSEDTPFDSPSAAASIVSGRSANGRKAWVFTDASGVTITYGEWQEAQVAKVDE